MAMPAQVIKGDTSEGIYRSARELIRNGTLRPGDTLPPLRELAASLSVNRNTVAGADRRLAFDVYVHADRRRGTIVVDNGRTAPATPASAPGLRNLSDGNPDPALLPDLSEALRRAASRKYLYGEFVESLQLVEALPIFFRRPEVQPAQIAVVGGAMDGLERILSGRFKPGDRVILEDPCFGSALDVVRTLGMVPVPVQVDQHGIVPSSLEGALRRNPQAIVITPVAHNPTGATMTADRLERLIHILDKHEDLLVIEDDHFGVLCADALPSNYGARGKNWIAICSVSKFFGPDMRFAALFGNPDIIRTVKARQRLGARWVSHLLQGAVLHLITDPETKSHLANVSSIYAERRASVKAHLERLGFMPTPGVALNIWVPTPHAHEIAYALSGNGWMVRPGRDLTLEAPLGIRVSTGRTDPAVAEDFVNALEACVTYADRSFAA
jgi:DNA-binding transcriptional MocR family regulator